MVLAVLVHDPGHHVGRRPHVGGGNVDIGADQIVDRVDEPARDPLELMGRALFWVERDPPLGPAVGDVDDGCLPGHEGRQPPDLVEIDLRMVAQPPLHRPAGVVVLDAVANEGGHLP